MRIVGLDGLIRKIPISAETSIQNKIEACVQDADNWTPIGMAAWRVLKEVNQKRKKGNTK